MYMSHPIFIQWATTSFKKTVTRDTPPQTKKINHEANPYVPQVGKLNIFENFCPVCHHIFISWATTCLANMPHHISIIWVIKCQFTEPPHFHSMSHHNSVQWAIPSSYNESSHFISMSHHISISWATRCQFKIQWATTSPYYEWVTTFKVYEPPRLHPMSHHMLVQRATTSPSHEPPHVSSMSHHIFIPWATTR